MLHAEILISYNTVREAEAVAEAVMPDNVRIPKGLVIKTSRDGVKFLTSIKCRTKLLTFISTIDDLMGSVSVAERCILAVKAPKKRS